MLTVIHASLQALEHGYTEDAVYRLYDEYVEEGHNMYDLIPVIIDVFKVSGIFSDEARGKPTQTNKRGGRPAKPFQICSGRPYPTRLTRE